MTDLVDTARRTATGTIATTVIVMDIEAVTSEPGTVIAAAGTDRVKRKIPGR
ncbi:hypothetical protein [Novosphingobium gossypii]|uniref:hypothetical protein n=1 Tax=Novosphingobium gossypii TaxID=1604774 RepID=UPI003D1A6BC7